MQAEPHSGTIRPPAVAGMFYPGNPDRLRMDVRDLLGRFAPQSQTPKALIAPHAGYIYSGHVAAAAFATVRDSAHAIKRVVLIGPAHYVPVRAATRMSTICRSVLDAARQHQRGREA